MVASVRLTISACIHRFGTFRVRWCPASITSSTSRAAATPSFTSHSAPDQHDVYEPGADCDPRAGCNYTGRGIDPGIRMLANLRRSRSVELLFQRIWVHEARKHTKIEDEKDLLYGETGRSFKITSKADGTKETRESSRCPFSTLRCPVTSIGNGNKILRYRWSETPGRTIQRQKSLPSGPFSKKTATMQHRF